MGNTCSACDALAGDDGQYPVGGGYRPLSATAAPTAAQRKLQMRNSALLTR